MAKKMAKTEAEGTKSKSEIVRELLSKGVTAPKKVSQQAKELYNVDIAPGYVSIIKTSDKKKKLMPPRRAAKAAVAEETAAAPVAAAASSGSGSGSGSMEMENAALKLALRSGGIENAIKLLRKLQG